MSRNAHVCEPVAQAFGKASTTEGDNTRKETIKTFDRMAKQCEDWLVANGIPPEENPMPGREYVDFVDYTRHINMSSNVPANLNVLESLNEIYAAEGALLNNTQRALMRHHIRFDKDPQDPGYLSVPKQHEMMQAMAAKVRGETDELTRKTYAVYNSGPPQTHRVMPTNDYEDLLQLWAKKRGVPNEAEMYMLAKYIGVNVFDIYDWFKAKDLQTNAISLVLGAAFSDSPALRGIGNLRYRAAQVQNTWRLKLERLREERRQAKRAADAEKGCQGSAGGAADEGDEGKGYKYPEITWKEVRGEMKPYIDYGMD